MTIHLPEDLERFVHDQVSAGRFLSEDDVIREALERLRKRDPIAALGLGSIGAMRDDTELLDQVIQDIMEGRRTRTLRLTPDELARRGLVERHRFRHRRGSRSGLPGVSGTVTSSSNR